MATKEEEVFKKEEELSQTKAAKDFCSRKEGSLVEDGRNFNTWYHIDDAQRLIWKYFNDLKEKPVQGTSQLVKDLTLPPYVSFDAYELNVINFFTILINYFQQPEHQQKRYLPFMGKLEIGGAHYIAGMLRRNAEGELDLIIFNPVGISKANRIGNELAKLDQTSLKIANIISSPHPIQSTAEDKDNGALVSCGPICVEFLHMALANLDWLAKLDLNFDLPAEFIKPLQQNYQETIKQYRLKHAQLLEQVTDNDLVSLDNDYTSINNYMWNGLSEWLQKNKPAALENSSEDEADGIHNDFFDELDYEPSEEDFSSSDEEQADDSEEDLVSESEKIDEPKEEKKETAAVSPPISPRVSPTPSSKVEHKQVIIDVPRTDNRREEVKEANLPLNKRDAFAPDIACVQKEIDRLRKASKSFFSIKCAKKALLIETALQEAAKKDQDVRYDPGVREALGYHRIFGFFGRKKATALQHVEQTLTPSPKP
ncbi:hypothetical protein ACNVED_10845 [Legionella sp. D16C41]|uniref:hypothetical protein n=1 Tax=Legionella sp. D16C41 TaxID=3402688 RepID=UPI003AF4B8E1